jgi:low affinity Fe/Cu permease
MIEALFQLVLTWGIIVIVALALIIVCLVIFINTLTKHYIDAIRMNERKDLKIIRQNGEIEKLKYELREPMGRTHDTNA